MAEGAVSPGWARLRLACDSGQSRLPARMLQRLVARHRTPAGRTVTRLSSEATSGLTLLSRVVDVWDVKETTTLRNAAVRIDRLTGAQLKQLIQDLPDGPRYALEADREDS